jgi:biotin transport system substrate-specific component
MTSQSRRLFILSALFTALTVVGAQIRIPLPYVPLTLQTFFVLLSGFMLGPIYGAVSQIAYLFLGLIGLPVFAEGGGMAYIFKPTFGYLLGFPLASLTAGMVVHRRSWQPRALPNVTMIRLALAGGLALLAIFLPGVLYLWWNINFVIEQPLSFSRAFYTGFLVFLPGDLIKITGAIFLYRALQPRLEKVVPFSESAR